MVTPSSRVLGLNQDPFPKTYGVGHTPKGAGQDGVGGVMPALKEQEATCQAE